jgi:hypothetical protein
MVARLHNPRVSVNDASRWLKLRDLANVSKVFAPVEIKAYYVFGLIYDTGLSVDWLLKAPNAWPNTYLPALSVFASAIELLGRCLTGNTSDRVNENLRVGFFYLAHPTNIPPQISITDAEYQSTVVKTRPGMSYRVADLVTLRHYGAHGQATTRNALPNIDNELLETLRAPFGTAVETYWTGLQENDEYCTRMAQARVCAYANRAEPLRRVIDIAARGAMSQWVFDLTWRAGP